MGQSVGEFFIDLFVDATKGELTIGGLVKSMGELEVASVGEITILATLAQKLNDITVETMHTAAAYVDLKSATGGSMQAFQEWKAMADVVGEGEAVASTFQDISKSISDMIHLGSGSPLAGLFTKLQIPDLAKFPENAPEKILEAIRNSPIFQKMTTAEKLSTLGLAHLESMRRVLSTDTKNGGLGREEAVQAIKDRGIISNEEINNWEKIHRQFISIAALSLKIKDLIAGWSQGWLSSSLGKVLESFRTEFESLKTIKDYVANKTYGQAGGELTKAAAMAFGEAILDHFGFTNQAVNGIQPVTPSAITTGGGATFYYNPLYQTTVNGSKMSEDELSSMMKEVFRDHSAEDRRDISRLLGTGPDN